MYVQVVIVITRYVCDYMCVDCCRCYLATEY